MLTVSRNIFVQALFFSLISRVFDIYLLFFYIFLFPFVFSWHGSVDPVSVFTLVIACLQDPFLFSLSLSLSLLLFISFFLVSLSLSHILKLFSLFLVYIHFLLCILVLESYFPIRFLYDAFWLLR